MMAFTSFIHVLFLVFILDSIHCINDDSPYEVGFGIADITGPAAEINMMGYAKPAQDTEGIHTRLYSRAVIIHHPPTNKRVIFVTAELCSLTDIVKMLVIEELSKLYGPTMYRDENVMLTASHTHSGPGGYFQYLLYLVTSEGFQGDSLDAIVQGIVLSIRRAHNKLQPAKIGYSEDYLLETSINRSPTAYKNNPIEERNKYDYDTDKNMQSLAVHDLNGNPLGLVNWFAVHGTSMNNTNRLISSDNKGYASKRFEQDFASNQSSINLDQQRFVAIFAQANEGDSSPNTMGATCKDSGLPCDVHTSTCPKGDICVGSGPGGNMFESTQIIGDQQYKKARELFSDSSEPVSGPIDYIHQTLNMSNHLFEFENGSTFETCTAALGYSFAAGTTDGEGAAFFAQGTTTKQESIILNFIRDFIVPLTQEQIDCHKPKAVLLPVGEMKFPYLWSGDIVPTQIIEIGQIVIIGVPAEFTTMAGRRLRDDVERIYKEKGRNVIVILSGLANSYTNYVTTPEEYQIQRYEGGSTLFGIRTLDAYRAQYRKLAQNLIEKTPIPAGPKIPNLLSKQLTWKPGVIYDGSFLRRFGKVILQPEARYQRGDTVRVKFVGANPRNNLHLEGTFLEVSYRANPTLPWTVYATDADWSTKFIWERTNLVIGSSQVTIIWDIPADAPRGEYYIAYYGDAKTLLRLASIEHFVGKSQTFDVI